MNQKLRHQKVKKGKKSVNQYLILITKKYFLNSTRSELSFDVGVPFIVSVVLFSIVGMLSASTVDIIHVFTVITTNSLSVLAILAGFNTTCLAVIASTNQETLKNLVEQGSKDGKDSILHKIITFFSYAICTEILLLITSIIYMIINKNISDIIGFYSGVGIKTVVSIVGVISATALLHTLFVSLRNVSLLFMYVLFIAKK